MTEISAYTKRSWGINAQNILFILFILDIFFLGSGLNYTVLGIGTRKIIFTLFALVSALVYIVQPDRFRVKTVSQIAGLIIMIATWVFILPFIGHGNLEHALSDAIPLLAAAVFIISKNFATKAGCWDRARVAVYYSVAIFACLHVFLYVIFSVRPDSVETVTEILKALWEPTSAEMDYFVFFTALDNGLQRIYFGSSFLLCLGIYFSLNKANPVTNSVTWRLCLFFITLLALLATNTRSLMLGAMIFVVFYSVFKIFVTKISTKYSSILVLLAAPFVLSFLLVPTIDPQTLSLIGLTREGSDDLRAEQLLPLFKGFLENPFFGKGFGSYVNLIRSENAPYAYELAIVALFMKLGIVGIIFLFLILALVIHTSVAPFSPNLPEKVALVYSLYFSYVFSCFYNPYMFGFFGTFFALFLLHEFAYLAKASNDD